MTYMSMCVSRSKGWSAVPPLPLDVAHGFKTFFFLFLVVFLGVPLPPFQKDPLGSFEGGVWDTLPFDYYFFQLTLRGLY